MEPVIEFRAVSKRYIVGGGRSLRSALAALPQRALGRAPQTSSEFWAIKDVDFAIEPGQSVGFLGHNGAGKTTILKLLSGITRPTQGHITVRGRVGTLIELGAGFHPEMSGRENVYLNGVILGMTRREVAHRFDSIVEFAGIGDFLDTPVKRYSSGMYVRLAFAVAAHIDPAVLLVDEVLAVGDIGFRAKCYRRMAELRANGTTVVLVSHDVYAIRDTCDRALLLWQGKVLEDGAPDAVIGSYLARMEAAETKAPPISEAETGPNQNIGNARPKAERAAIRSVRLLDRAGRAVTSIVSGEAFTIEVDYEAFEVVRQPIFRVDFYRQGVLVSGSSTAYDGIAVEPLEGTGSFCLGFERLFLSAGVYTLSIVIAETYEYNLLDVHHQAYPLQVLRPPNSRGDLSLPRTWHHTITGGNLSHDD